MPGCLPSRTDFPAAWRWGPGLSRKSDRRYRHGGVGCAAPEGCPGKGETGMSEYLLLRHRDIPDLDQLAVYRKNGGFKAWEKLVTSMEPAEMIQLAKDSGLRGRGGAGFPAGMKWSV